MKIALDETEREDNEMALGVTDAAAATICVSPHAAEDDRPAQTVVTKKGHCHELQPEGALLQPRMINLKILLFLRSSESN